MSVNAMARFFAVLGLGLLISIASADPTSSPTGRRAVAGKTAPPGGIAWSSLDAPARQALAPLERDWAMMESPQRDKWVEMAQRWPDMSHDQRQRIQARMTVWARLTPAERGQARLRFIQAQRTAGEDRDQRWGDYQALPNDQKKKFAARAAVPAGSAPNQSGRPAGDGGFPFAPSDSPTAKSNLVTNPNFSAQPRPIAPMTLKAGPGVSTTLVSKPPTPPAHQQTGLPKITASPGFVDQDTLLPKRGPQGAATAPFTGDETTPSPVPRP